MQCSVVVATFEHSYLNFIERPFAYQGKMKELISVKTNLSAQLMRANKVRHEFSLFFRRLTKLIYR